VQGYKFEAREEWEEWEDKSEHKSEHKSEGNRTPTFDFEDQDTYRYITLFEEFGINLE
jgi:hypothetical protein